MTFLILWFLSLAFVCCLLSDNSWRHKLSWRIACIGNSSIIIRKHRPAVVRLKGFQLALRYMHCSIQASETSFVCEVWLVPRAHYFLLSHTILIYTARVMSTRHGNWFSTARAIWRNSIQKVRPSVVIQQLHQLLLCGGEKDIATFDGALLTNDAVAINISFSRRPEI